jgi:hypothetical protein
MGPRRRTTQRNRSRQWNFSPRGPTREVEDYRFNLDSVAVLELTLRPALQPNCTLASLTAWRVAKHSFAV